ncbi:MAG: nucleotide sugar dehydrogenase, partial [Chloroflexota bacterium]
MANICVLGAGHAGLATAVSFAELGHRVTVLEINRKKVRQLNGGSSPYYEPGLDELLRRNLERGHLHITTSCPRALRKSEFVFISVGTPGCAGGAADLSALWQATRSICQYVAKNTVVVNKSTVPVGTADRMDEFIRRNRPPGDSLLVVANPEFFAEGSAVQDLLHPEMQIIGSSQAQASEAVAELYRPYGCLLIITDTRTAEMSKYAINTFIAVKISFVNELAA